MANLIDQAIAYFEKFNFSVDTTNEELAEYINHLEGVVNEILAKQNEKIVPTLRFIDFVIFKIKTAAIASNRYNEINRCEEFQFHLRTLLFKNIKENDKKELQNFINLLNKGPQ